MTAADTDRSKKKRRHSFAVGMIAGAGDCRGSGEAGFRGGGNLCRPWCGLQEMRFAHGRRKGNGMNAKELIPSFGARVGGYLPVSCAPRVPVSRTEIPVDAFVVAFSVPYFTNAESNLAAFAAVPDYHAYAKQIGEVLGDYISGKYPESYLRVFADVSPFLETQLSCACGLGVLGDHGMIIDEEYSSFVFLGEAVFGLGEEQLAAEGFSPADGVIRYCEHCGQCRRACPTGGIDDKMKCLSSVTQKKGDLSDEERALLKENLAVWGCDRCILACPHTKKPPRGSGIPYFSKDRLGTVFAEDILGMSDEEYKRYSFSWRKREVLVRNLRICGYCREDSEKL